MLEPVEGDSPLKGVDVLFFGARPDPEGNPVDWSFKEIHPDGDPTAIQERLRMLSKLPASYDIGPAIFSPVPSQFNGKIINPGKLRTKGYILKEGVPFVMYRGGPTYADGVVLEPGQTFAVSSADCPTLVVQDPESGLVGVAHCGLLSLARNVVGNLFEVLGGDPKRLRAFITAGAHFLPYTIGGSTHPEIKALLERGNGEVYNCGNVLLYSIITKLLEQGGIDRGRVDYNTICTVYPEGVDVYSQHRDQGTDRAGKRNLVIVHNRGPAS